MGNQSESQSSFEQRRHGLLIRPCPVAGEASTGYLIRVAESNGFSKPSLLLAALGDVNGENPFEILMCRVEATRVDEKLLLGPVPRAWGTRLSSVGVSKVLFNLQLMRWCPECLAERAILRGEWCLKLCCVCSRHGVMLCDRCPSCGETQGLQRAEIDRCRCGARLNGAPKPNAPRALIVLNNFLVYSAFSDKEIGDASRLDANSWHRFICYFGRAVLRQRSECREPRGGIQALPIATAILSAAASLFATSPPNYEAFLTSLRRKEFVPSSDLYFLRRLYRPLYTDFHSRGFSFLHERPRLGHSQRKANADLCMTVTSSNLSLHGPRASGRMSDERPLLTENGSFTSNSKLRRPAW